MALPLIAVAVGSAVGGAFLYEKFTGAAGEAGEALEKGGGALLKVAAVAGLAYAAWEIYSRGGFR